MERIWICVRGQGCVVYRWYLKVAEPEGGFCQVKYLHCPFEGVQVVPDECVTGKFVLLLLVRGNKLICGGRWIFVCIYMGDRILFDSIRA